MRAVCGGEGEMAAFGTLHFHCSDSVAASRLARTQASPAPARGMDGGGCHGSEDGDGVESRASERTDATASEEEETGSASKPYLRKQMKAGGNRAMSKAELKRLHRQEMEPGRQPRAAHAFHSFYHAQFGQRWPSLLSALQARPRACCLVNDFADPEFLKRSIAGLQNATRVSFIKPLAYESTHQFPHPERDPHNLYAYYLLDAASVMVTESLEICQGDRVLDLCAAPGGKSLSILLQLGLPRGMLTANELSSDRRQRLRKVILDYVPENLRYCVKVTGKDGTRWIETELYDKVLIDAPCSSERHLLHDFHEFHRWTEKRSINCATRQLALLAAGWRSVRVGGIIVYSTCSISNLENDGVITKAVVKAKGRIQTVQRTWAIGEKTEHGWIILPDAAHGWGPIYFSILKKVF